MKRLYTLLFLLFILAACSSSEEDQDPNPTSPDTISMVTTTATPGQFVYAEVSKKLDITANTIITVGGVAVQVIPGDNHQIMFLMPVLPSGKATVDFTGAGIAKQIEITVGNYTAIAEPDEVIATFTAELNEIATHFGAHTKNPEIQLNASYITILDKQKQILAENFAKLSPQEKLQVAYILKNAMPNDEDFILEQNLPAANLRTSSAMQEDAGEALVNTARSLGRNVVRGIPLTYAGFQLLLLPSPTLVDKVAAAGFLTAGFVYIMNALSDAKKVGALPGILEALTGAERMAASTSGEISFYKNQARLLTVKANYRNLQQSDSSSPVADIAGVFSSIIKLEDLYNKAISISNKVGSWFDSSIPSLPAYSNPIGARVITKEHILPGNGLSITNNSEPGIKLTTSSAENGINITAKSNTIAQDKAFTFDVIYTDKRFNKTLTKKVNAVFIAGQPQAVSIIDGNNQLAEPGKALAKPLKVKVIDANGETMQGIDVLWTVKAGNGTLSSSKSVTDEQGIAQTNWIMSQSPNGEQIVEAIVKKSDGTLVSGSPLLFTANLNVVLESGSYAWVCTNCVKVDNNMHSKIRYTLKYKGTIKPGNGSRIKVHFRHTGTSWTGTDYINISEGMVNDISKTITWEAGIFFGNRPPNTVTGYATMTYIDPSGKEGNSVVIQIPQGNAK